MVCLILFAIKLLQQAAQCLSELEQSPSLLILESMKRLVNAIVKPELLKHQDRDVRLLVATCICEITRVTAPEPPYSDDVLKVVHLNCWNTRRIEPIIYLIRVGFVYRMFFS